MRPLCKSWYLDDTGRNPTLWPSFSGSYRRQTRRFDPDAYEITGTTAYDLHGKVALITGGARGIGLGTAKALHARGAEVVLVDLDAAVTQRAAASISTSAMGIGGDVTDRASLDAAVAAAVERFGGVDIAIANAGVSPHGCTARVCDDALFERVIDVNLLGVWRTVRACLPPIAEIMA